MVSFNVVVSVMVSVLVSDMDSVMASVVVSVVVSVMVSVGVVLTSPFVFYKSIYLLYFENRRPKLFTSHNSTFIFKCL